MMSPPRLFPLPRRRVPDPLATAADDELRAHVERALADRYELDCEVGRGGMGVVYRARDRRLKRPVAIKLLPPELAFRSEVRSRFLREAETAAQLSHPHIVPIYTVEEVEQLVFFVMAYVGGANLAQRLHEGGTLPSETVRRILCEVASALAYAHERGVVHRDIKPDNILLEGVSGRALVTDFGIARAMDGSGESRLTATGMAIGTPAYMSPEQAAGEREIDGRSDLYSVGILGYQMLTGEPPFQAASTPAMLVKHIAERPVPVEQRRRDVPVDLARCVMTLLEKNPSDRFPTADALVAALETRSVGIVTGTPARTGEPSSPGEGGGTAEANVAERAAVLDRPERLSPPAGTTTPRPTRGSAPEPYLVGDRLAMAALSSSDADAEPSAAERVRWEALPVIACRRKLRRALFWMVAFAVGAVVMTDVFWWVVFGWAVSGARSYQRLTALGFDWHDILREPAERGLDEVLDERLDHLRAFWDPAARQRVRARRVLRRRHRLTPTAPEFRAAPPAPSALPSAPVEDAAVQQARLDRDEVLRRIETLGSALPRSQREELEGAARALAERVEGLARAEARWAAEEQSAARRAVEEEIAALEAAANPLERGSEERVRRLARLRRQRRSLADEREWQATWAAKREACLLALQNMRFDLLRLGTTPQTCEQITSLAHQAIRLADDVDDAVAVAQEVARLNAGRAVSGGAPDAR